MGCDYLHPVDFYIPKAALPNLAIPFPVKQNPTLKEDGILFDSLLTKSIVKP
jgi:hypothetical protein